MAIDKWMSAREEDVNEDADAPAIALDAVVTVVAAEGCLRRRVEI